MIHPHSGLLKNTIPYNINHIWKPSYISHSHIPRTYSTLQTQKSKFRFRNYAFKGFLCFIVPYTTYVLSIFLITNKKINNRSTETELLEPEGNLNQKGTLKKYSPVQTLGRYENPFVEYRRQTLYEFFANRTLMLFQRNKSGIPSNKDGINHLMPVYTPTWTIPSQDIETINSSTLKCRIVDSNKINNQDSNHESEQDTKADSPIYNTWLGQSCNYVVYKDIKILTDPLFSDYLIHKTLGPKRITGIPCDISHIPDPDIILVSHNHPDHLDYESLYHWNKDSTPLWLIPKGLGPFMEKHNCTNFIELSWWESLELTKNGQTYHISSTPAMHWSGRSLFDTNESLWCSFLLSHQGKPILFHAGDTGYVNDLYVRIKNQFGEGCKLALLPCGQYCPEWHQRPRHINPGELMQIMNDMGIRNALGVHWGTFVLSGEYFLEPKETLERLAQEKGILDRCFCPELGKTIRFD